MCGEAEVKQNLGVEPDLGTLALREQGQVPSRPCCSPSSRRFSSCQIAMMTRRYHLFLSGMVR